MGLLEDKVAIVTGAAQGIGAAIASRLAAEGAAVALVDVNAEGTQQRAALLRETGATCEAYATDVSDCAQVAQVVSEILERFGRVDILVNNAGVTRDGLIVRMSEEDWDLVLGVNLKGVFNFTKAVTRTMMKQRSGCIVNLSSIVGMRGNAGQINYAASKAGVIGATQAAAKELAPRGIRVNAVAPGYIQTPMTDTLDDKTKEALLGAIPAGRLGTPEDIANAILFLVSDDAAYVTGEVMRVDGGLAM